MREEPVTVVPVRLGHANVWLCRTVGGGVLIDAGLPGSLERISRSIIDSGMAVADLSLIVVTHAHYDHVGALAEMQAVSGAPVLSTPGAALHLAAGRTPFPRGTNPWTRFVSGAARRLAGKRRQFRPVTPDQTVDAETDLSAYALPGRVLPLPGHTAGSLALLLDSGEAFIGDAAFNIFPRSTVPPFADDPATLVESWKILLAGGATTFYPGHGRPFGRDRLEASLPILERTATRSRP